MSTQALMRSEQTALADQFMPAMRPAKAKWQREQRRQFREEHGYSTKAHYDTAGLRAAVLARDGYACVKCGMTDAEHKAAWGRPITVDHVDKDRRTNSMDNLQTLCLPCHGRKDLIPALRVQKIPAFRERITTLRAAGATYKAIADALGFSAMGIWKWCNRWEI
jgi:hypothetical protein